MGVVGRPWTPDTVAELTALAAQKLPHDEIGRRINRTTNAVAQKLTVLGLRTGDRKPLMTSEINEMRRLFRDGMKKIDIARRMNRGINSVQKACAVETKPEIAHPAIRPASEPFIRPPTLAQLMAGRAR